MAGNSIPSMNFILFSSSFNVSSISASMDEEGDAMGRIKASPFLVVVYKRRQNVHKYIKRRRRRRTGKITPVVG